MIKYFRYFSLILLALVAIHFVSCKEKEAKEDLSDVKGHYFSVNGLILDEWNNFIGNAFVIQKTLRINDGRTDTTYTNSDTINWAPIFLTFSATDISDRKYLGQYNFNQFDDPQDGTHNFFYMSKDPDLFTQKLLITIDERTMKVKGIYIETFEKKAWKETIQKLYYSPLKTIQIQTDNKPVIGKQVHTIRQWDFMR